MLEEVKKREKQAKIFRFENERIKKLENVLSKIDNTYFSVKRSRVSHSLDNKDIFLTFSKPLKASQNQYDLSNKDNDHIKAKSKAKTILSPIPLIDKVLQDKTLLAPLNENNKFLPLRNQTSNAGRVFNDNISDANFDVKVVYASGNQKFSKLILQKDKTKIKDNNKYLQENLQRQITKNLSNRELFKSMNLPQSYKQNIKYVVKNLKNDDEVNRFIQFVSNNKQLKVKNDQYR